MAANRSIWELFLKDSVSSKLSALNGGADKLSNSFGNAQDRLNKMHTGLKGMANEIPGLSRGMEVLNNPMVLAGSGLALVGAGLYKATSFAMDFETGMAKINATAQLSKNDLGKLHDRLTQIGSSSGGNFARIPESFEKILSVNGKVNESLDILKTSVKGAKAGFADLDIVGNAIAKTMSAVGDKNLKAKDLLDTFMMAKNVGAGEFTDFANYMPELIAASGVAGYSHKDAVGMFATLTKTFGAAQSATYEQNILTAFQKTDVVSGLEKGIPGMAKGIQIFKNGMRRPIYDVLQDLQKVKDSMNPQQFMNYLDKVGLKDAQAKIGLGALIGDAEKLKTVFDGMNKSIGETDRQLSATGNTARTWADIKDMFSSIAESIGSKFLPVIDAVGKVIQGISTQFSKLKNTVESGAKINNVMKLSDDSFKAKYGFSAPSDGKSGLDKEQTAYLKLARKAAYNVFFDSEKDGPGKKQSEINKALAGGVDKSAKVGSDTKMQNTVDGVSGGGKNIRNVNVTIHKMVEQLIVKANSVKEGAGDIERHVQEILTRAIQGSEVALSNG